MKNHTGTIHYVHVYESEEPSSSFYNLFTPPKATSPIGHGFIERYYTKTGVKEHVTIVDNDGNILSPGWLKFKVISEDVLVVINRTVQ